MPELKTPTWEKTKTQFLLKNTQSGIYYARAFTQGKEVWKSLRTDVYSVARERLKQTLADLKRLDASLATVESGTGTVENATDIYIERVRKTVGIKPSTVHYREQLIKALFRSWPELRTEKLRDVSERECLDFASRFAQASSPTRYNNLIDSLRAIFEIGIENGIANRNPASKIGKRRPNAKKLKLPSSDEFAALVKEIRSAGAWCSEQCGDLVEFLAYSGCRLKEAAAVRWQDVDLEKGVLWVHGGDHGTKNHDRRSVPVIAPLRRLLDDFKASPRYFRNEERLKSGLILPVVESQKAIDKACGRLGLERITHHDLRHLFATRCIESGVDVPTVSRWLGHKDGGALAMRTYGYLRDEHSKAMAARVSF